MSFDKIHTFVSLVICEVGDWLGSFVITFYGHQISLTIFL